MKSVLRVTCFGKLPIYSDFVEPVHRTRFADDLRTWLAAGAGRPAENPGAPKSREARRAYRVAWPLRKGKEILVAVLWSSHDAVHRSFPFAIYTQVKTRRLGLTALAELPFALEELWNDLVGLASTPDGIPWVDLAPGSVDPRGIQTALEKARIELRPQAKRRELRTTGRNDGRGGSDRIGCGSGRLLAAGTSELIELLSPPHDPAGFPRVAWRIAAIVRTIEHGGASALWLPASDRLSVLLVASFFLEMISSLATRPIPLPGLFLPLGAPSGAALWLFFREPMPIDLPLLLADGTPHAWVEDLRFTLPAEGAEESTPAPEPFEHFRRAITGALVNTRALEDLARLPALVLQSAERDRPEVARRHGG